ncbi:MAG: ATP synthase F0 subunit C [Candidatus Riflebacteria bacterium]|nr:ATP synthase F0 subunit C [Candidatus Riflebacteria bacterium]
MSYLSLLVITVGFGVPLAVLTAAIGQGRAASAALEGMARQPELAGKLQTAMIIALVFIESLVIYALVIFFMLKPYLPETEKVLGIMAKTAQVEAPEGSAAGRSVKCPARLFDPSVQWVECSRSRSHRVPVWPGGDRMWAS